jgi:ectoine hydroxylase-related dioxygenase (phytanoyl-CoA dioxygenase family)
MEPRQQDHQSYRFDFKDTERWLSHLTDKGFVVVSGVVTPDDAKKALADMKECIKKFAPNLKDEKSWSQEKNYPHMLNGGMVQYVGHAKFQWDLREKVAPIFAKIWGCETTDLATSFDGFCFMHGKRKFKASHPLNTVHSDQSPLRDLLWSVQGLVNLNDCGENDGGLVVVPESHKVHQEIFKKFGREGHESDWYKFTPEEKSDPVFENYIKICGKAGDFMMWDSRVFHCNTVPTTPNIRACVYICQIPKEKIPKQTVKRRQEAWMGRRCSNHHPGDGFTMFPAVPRYADPAIKEIAPVVSVEDDDLTPLQKSLLHVE